MMPVSGVAAAVRCLCTAGLLLLIRSLGPADSWATADDWPQFLGPTRSGISAETGLLPRWPVTGPRVLWRRSLGDGMSGIAVQGAAAVTLFQDAQQQFAICLSTADGSELWRTPLAPRYENAMGHGPRATPTLSAASAFVYTGEGILACLNQSDGRLQWSVNVPESLAGKPSEYGMSCSPLVAGQAVIVHAGTASAAVAAFDRSSGKLLWQAGQGAAGYSSPVLLQLAGRQQVVAFVGTELLSLDPQQGTILWRYPFATDYACNTANPVQLDPASLLISAGENQGSVILQVTADGEQLQVSETWTSPGRDGLLHAEWQTPVLLDGHLYGFDNQGSAGPITHLVCLRLADRTLQWKQARFGKGNLIAADGKLYLTMMSGEVILVSASPRQFTELGRMAVLESTRQAPALSAGRLFVRDHREVVCIDVRNAGG